MEQSPKFIIVIGASSGGLTALSEIVGQFDEKLDASFFVVLHLSKTAISDYLLHRLQPLTQLKCMIAKDRMPLHRGHIYIAPPNEHLIVIKDQIVVGYGPEENFWRPSIDVLFRSAAAAYNARVIGAILTGFLSDGTAGMQAIKKSGGTTIVQDPNEAEAPDMPLSVLSNMEVDHIVKLGQFGDVLTKVTQHDPEAVEPPADVTAEANLVERMVVGIERVQDLGEQSPYTCPDCGGTLWKVGHGENERFRCFTGHAYDENELLIKQSENVESTIWVAVRMMEERKNLYTKIAKQHEGKGHSRLASSYKLSADDLSKHIDNFKQILISMHKARVEEIQK
jgi:two-component system, chemotaxis family, protein-glutamate methylesterase/glutaminase